MSYYDPTYYVLLRGHKERRVRDCPQYLMDNSSTSNISTFRQHIMKKSLTLNQAIYLELDKYLIIIKIINNRDSPRQALSCLVQTL